MGKTQSLLGLTTAHGSWVELQRRRSSDRLNLPPFTPHRKEDVRPMTGDGCIALHQCRPRSQQGRSISYLIELVAVHLRSAAKTIDTGTGSESSQEVEEMGNPGSAQLRPNIPQAS